VIEVLAWIGLPLGLLLLAAGARLEARAVRRRNDQYPPVTAAGTFEEWQTPTRE
jgi:hypothetical protein